MQDCDDTIRASVKLFRRFVIESHMSWKMFDLLSAQRPLQGFRLQVVSIYLLSFIFFI